MFRARHAKTRFATLAALTALCATAALAPTPAAAVINNSGTSGCAAPHPGDQIYWNGGSWCAVQEGAGGTAATGTGAGSSTGAGSPGIFFWAQSDAPNDLPSTCSYKNAGACMPTQRGGREVQEAKDGPIAGTRGGTGSKGAGKSETSKRTGKPKLTPKQECQELMVVGMIWSPPEVLSRALSQAENAQKARYKAVRLKIGELSFELAAAQKNQRLGYWDPVAVATIKSRIGALVREAEAVQDEILPVIEAREQWEKKKCPHLLYDV